MVNRPLIGLLGAHWTLGARVSAGAWSSDEAVAAFGLEDGAVVLVRAQWTGGPEVRTREGGGVEVTPPADPSPPVSRVAVHKGACRALAADPDAPGFLCGGDDGRLVRLATDGTEDPATGESDGFPERPIALVVAGVGGRRACASGPEVHVSGRGHHVLQLPSTVTVLAFDPVRRLLAIAHDDGVAIWSDDGGTVRHLASPGRPCALAWSPDGKWLVAGLHGDTLHGWRVAGEAAVEPAGIELGACLGTPIALSFAFDGSFLAASGASRVTCWRVDTTGRLAESVDCCLPNRLTHVCAVACHPSLPVVAAGYGNGAVLLCQPGTDDALFAKAWGGGSVTALAWSATGRRLALGTDEGEAGILLLPEALLRASRARPHAPLHQEVPG